MREPEAQVLVAAGVLGVGLKRDNPILVCEKQFTRSKTKQNDGVSARRTNYEGKRPKKGEAKKKKEGKKKKRRRKQGEKERRDCRKTNGETQVKVKTIREKNETKNLLIIKTYLSVKNKTSAMTNKNRAILIDTSSSIASKGESALTWRRAALQLAKLVVKALVFRPKEPNIGNGVEHHRQALEAQTKRPS